MKLCLALLLVCATALASPKKLQNQFVYNAGVHTKVYKDDYEANVLYFTRILASHLQDAPDVFRRLKVAIQDSVDYETADPYPGGRDTISVVGQVDQYNKTHPGWGWGTYFKISPEIIVSDLNTQLLGKGFENRPKEGIVGRVTRADFLAAEIPPKDPYRIWVEVAYRTDIGGDREFNAKIEVDLQSCRTSSPMPECYTRVID